MKNKKILIGISGSFCNHRAVLEEVRKLAVDNDITFVISENVKNLSTRFFEREAFLTELRTISGKAIIDDLLQAEVLGPQDPFDIMAIVPLSATMCTRMVHGLYDSPVTLAAKAMIRNQKNIVFGFASNDGLGISGTNLMRLLNMKHFYAVPFCQDAPSAKPRSIVADWQKLEQTLDAAFQNEQLQPLLLGSESDD